MRKMANSVNGEVVSLNSAFEEVCRCLSKFDVPCTFKWEQKQAISTLIFGKDLLAMLLTVFEKSLMLFLDLKVLVCLKVILTGKPSSVVVVCQPQRIVYDQMK